MAIHEIREAAFENGIWQAEVASVDQPDIVVFYQGSEVSGVSIEEVDTNLWEISVPIPSVAIAAGVHSFAVQERGADTTLTSFSILAGDVLAHDVRAEMSLMRAELDLLKRAFRRYVSENS